MPFKPSLSTSFILLFLSGGFALASTSEVDTALYFNEVDGIVVAEIESINPSSGWTEKTDRSGFTGSSFFEWTSSDQFNNPGLGRLDYLIKINDPGTYRFQWHCKVGHGSSNTEANDSWLRIPDASLFYAVKASNQDTVRPKGICTSDCPEGSGSNGWFKVYSSGTSSWTWSSRTSDSDPHLIYANFDSTGFYRLQISGRSNHHLLDRFILYKSSVTDPTNLSRSETKVDQREGYTGKLYLKVIDGESKTAIPRAKVFVNQNYKYCDNKGSAFYYNLATDASHTLSASVDGYHETEEILEMQGDTLVQIALDKFATHSKLALQNQYEVQISPNPVNDVLHIESEKGMEALFITDLTGKVVCQMLLSSDREVALATGHLKKGAYFVRIVSAGSKEIQTVKFVKME